MRKKQTKKEPNICDFNRRLKFVRESLGISRYEIERVSNIPEATLRKIENTQNDYVPSEIIVKIYNGFQSFKDYVDPNWLVYNTGEPPNFIDKIKPNFFADNKAMKLVDKSENEDKNIIYESLKWQELYDNATFIKVLKDYQTPNFKKNDYIYGLFFDKKEMRKFNSIDVMISTKSALNFEPFHFVEMLNDSEALLMRTCILNKIETKAVKLTEIDRVAKIVLHRKTFYSFKK